MVNWVDTVANKVGTTLASMGGAVATPAAAGGYVYNPATGKVELAGAAAPAATSSGGGGSYSGGGSVSSASQTMVNGGYQYREMPDGSVWAFRPDGSATVVMEAPAQPWATVNLGGGKVIQIGPNGEVREIVDPQAPATPQGPEVISASASGVWIRNPETGMPEFIPQPPAPGSTALKPASPTYTAPRATATARAVDPYKGTQMQIDATARENEKNRQFQAQQQALQDYNQLLQQATGLRFNAGESGLDRNMQGGWNEYQSAANNAQIELARRAEARQLAQQFQNAVQSANPIAMPALLAAGGGNISNAVARGATALTDTFLTPQAEMLRQTRIPYDPLPVYDYVPETNPFVPALPTGPAAPPPPPAPAETAPPTGTTGGRRRRGRDDD